MERVPDGPYRREILALEATPPAGLWPSGSPSGPRSCMEAADDQMAARNVAALVKLGVWPPAADDLHARQLLPADTYEMLRAVYLARSGDAVLGIAKLRELAGRSAHAAFELIAILEDLEGPESAIEEARRQAQAWPTPGLTLKLLDLLGKHSHEEQAAEMILRSSPDDSLPAEVRLRLANWYAARLGGQRRFAEAAAFAARSLEIGKDSDLAWILVKSLHNNGKAPAARDALARHRPEPVTDDEMRLSDAVAPRRAPHAGRRADDDRHRRPPARRALPRRGHRAAGPRGPPHPAPAGSQFPADIVQQVRQLQEQAVNRPGGTFRLQADDDSALREALQEAGPILSASKTAQPRHGKAGKATLTWPASLAARSAWRSCSALPGSFLRSTLPAACARPAIRQLNTPYKQAPAWPTCQLSTCSA